MIQRCLPGLCALLVLGILPRPAMAVDLAGQNISKERLVVYLFIGNSNMTGFDSSYKDTQTHPRAWNFKLQGKETNPTPPNQLAWVPARYAVHSGSGQGSGPAMSFLKKMADLYPEYHIGLIQNAKEIATVRSLERGRGRYWKGDALYNEIINAAKHVQKEATLGGIVAMLGLVEAYPGVSRPYAESFSDDIKQMVADMRKDLGEPDLPLIINRFEEGSRGMDVYPWSTIVRDEIYKIPGKVSRSVLVDRDGPYIDSHHFNKTGHILWGERAAELIRDRGWFPEAAPAVPTAPSITQHPVDTTTYEGGTASLTVKATGSTPLSYQWQRDGGDISGATSTTYVLTNVSAGDNGASFRCVVSNGLGTVTSNAARLTIASFALKINCGANAPTVSGWNNDDGYRSGGSDYTFSGTTDTSNVANAAPADIYKSVRHGDHTYSFSMPDGAYVLRLHFTDGFTDNRAMRFTAEGQVILDNFSIVTEAGGTYKALVKDFAVDVSGGDGMQLVCDQASGVDVFVAGIEIFSSGSAGNAAPAVNAGIDNAVTVGVKYWLVGTATDDELPGGPLAVAWSKISGPGNVEFGSADAVQTDVTFDAAGDYILRLTADDGALQAFEEVKITVNLEPTLKLIGPDGGEAWAAGSTQPIRWTSSGVLDVAILYSFDGGQTWITIAQSVNSRSVDWENYPWVVPDSPSDQVLVRLDEYFGGGATATSAGTFEIVSSSVPDTTPPVITLVTLAIAGTVDDPSIASVTVQGAAVSAINGSFQADVQLAPGSMTVLIKASDASENQATRTMTVSQ